MADFQEQDARTEPASPRKREQAAEEGRFAFSTDLNSGIVLIAGVGGLMMLAQVVGSGLLAQIRFDLPRVFSANLTCDDVQHLLAGKFWQMLSIAGMMLGVLFTALVAVNVGQVGVNFNVGKLAVDWEKVSPFHFDRLLGWDKVIRGLVMVCKVAGVGAVAWWLLRGQGDAIAGLNNASLGAALASAWHLIIRIAMSMAVSLLIIGVADYVYQRWRFEQSLYMTKEEIKEERKREEGNPQMKARIRRIQRDMALGKMYRKVPKATVVVTNPTHLAVALLFEAGKMAAPKVVAKGEGSAAKRIVAMARKHGVPVLERKPLAQALYKTVKIDADIPVALYMVVAELLAFVFRQRGVPVGK
jgi:flagellar biosynthetic protein FlhB